MTDILKRRIASHFDRYPFVRKQMTGSLLSEAETEIQSLTSRIEGLEGEKAELVGLLRNLRDEYCARIKATREPGLALCKAADAISARYQSCIPLASNHNTGGGDNG